MYSNQKVKFSALSCSVFNHELYSDYEFRKLKNQVVQYSNQNWLNILKVISMLKQPVKNCILENFKVRLDIGYSGDGVLRDRGLRDSRALIGSKWRHRALQSLIAAASAGFEQ